jgi:hypothetical protein
MWIWIKPFHLAFGSNHFQPIKKLNQSMPIILPRENRDIKIIIIKSNVFYGKNSLVSWNTWMHQTSLESLIYKWNSIDQVVQLNKKSNNNEYS